MRVLAVLLIPEALWHRNSPSPYLKHPLEDALDGLAELILALKLPQLLVEQRLKGVQGIIHLL